jgi:hypothetical protein
MTRCRPKLVLVLSSARLARTLRATIAGPARGAARLTRLCSNCRIQSISCGPAARPGASGGTVTVSSLGWQAVRWRHGGHGTSWHCGAAGSRGCCSSTADAPVARHCGGQGGCRHRETAYGGCPGCRVAPHKHSAAAPRTSAEAGKAQRHTRQALVWADAGVATSLKAVWRSFLSPVDAARASTPTTGIDYWPVQVWPVGVPIP